MRKTFGASRTRRRCEGERRLCCSLSLSFSGSDTLAQSRMSVKRVRVLTLREDLLCGWVCGDVYIGCPHRSSCKVVVLMVVQYRCNSIGDV